MDFIEEYGQQVPQCLYRSPVLGIVERAELAGCEWRRGRGSVVFDCCLGAVEAGGGEVFLGEHHVQLGVEGVGLQQQRPFLRLSALKRGEVVHVVVVQPRRPAE